MHFVFSSHFVHFVDRRNKLIKLRITKVAVYPDERSRALLYAGNSKQSPEDRDCLKEGKKQALNNALRFLSRGTKRGVWEEYWRTA